MCLHISISNLLTHPLTFLCQPSTPQYINKYPLFIHQHSPTTDPPIDIHPPSINIHISTINPSAFTHQHSPMNHSSIFTHQPSISIHPSTIHPSTFTHEPFNIHPPSLHQHSPISIHPPILNKHQLNSNPKPQYSNQCSTNHLCSYINYSSAYKPLVFTPNINIHPSILTHQSTSIFNNQYLPINYKYSRINYPQHLPITH